MVWATFISGGAALLTLVVGYVSLRQEISRSNKSAKIEARRHQESLEARAQEHQELLEARAKQHEEMLGDQERVAYQKANRLEWTVSPTYQACERIYLCPTNLLCCSVQVQPGEGAGGVLSY